MVIEVRQVLGQHCREMPAVDDQHPVQQFTADSSGIDAGSLEDRPHGTCRKLVAKPSEFAVDAPVTPGGVLGGQPQTTRRSSGAMCRPPLRLRRGWIQRRFTSPVPPQDRGRGDDPMQSAGWGH
jgi:hypothetical protein